MQCVQLNIKVRGAVKKNYVCVCVCVCIIVVELVFKAMGLEMIT